MKIYSQMIKGKFIILKRLIW